MGVDGVLDTPSFGTPWCGWSYCTALVSSGRKRSTDRPLPVIVHDHTPVRDPSSSKTIRVMLSGSPPAEGSSAVMPSCLDLDDRPLFAGSDDDLRALARSTAKDGRKSC